MATHPHTLLYRDTHEYVGNVCEGASEGVFVCAAQNGRYTGAFKEVSKLEVIVVITISHIIRT